MSVRSLSFLDGDVISSYVPDGKNPKGYEESIVALAQLERSFENALSMLALLNAPEPILALANRLHEELLSTIGFTEEKEERFGQELRKLETLMREDLQRTLST